MHRWLTLAVVAGLAVCWPLVAAAVDHGAFDKILRDHVKRGRVDYAAIKARAKKDLDRYVHALGQAKLDGLSRGEKLAFYLNAYNANVIKAVVERYPVASVAKVKGFFDRKKIRVAGSTLTLNALEHQVIRKRFAEPRIHFALVCAARSCPPLPSRAFSAKRLEQDLERLTHLFGRRHRRDREKPRCGPVALLDDFAGFLAHHGADEPDLAAARLEAVGKLGLPGGGAVRHPGEKHFVGGGELQLAGGRRVQLGPQPVYDDLVGSRLGDGAPNEGGAPSFDIGHPVQGSRRDPLGNRGEHRSDSEDDRSCQIAQSGDTKSNGHLLPPPRGDPSRLQC